MTKIIGLANSCKDCPSRHYYSGGAYECLKVKGSTLNADSSIPDWCPLTDYRVSASIADTAGAIEGRKCFRCGHDAHLGSCVNVAPADTAVAKAVVQQLRADVRSVMLDFARTPPEEDETWNSWYEASWDMAVVEVMKLFDAAPAMDTAGAIYQSRLRGAPSWTDVSHDEYDACSAKPHQFETRVVRADTAEAKPEPAYLESEIAALRERIAGMEKDAIRSLIARHAEEPEQNDYAYFELAYTRRTGWMAWICSNHREVDPNCKVIACGQGDTPDEACDAAIAKKRPRRQPSDLNSAHFGTESKEEDGTKAA